MEPGSVVLVGVVALGAALMSMYRSRPGYLGQFGPYLLLFIGAGLIIGGLLAIGMHK